VNTPLQQILGPSPAARILVMAGVGNLAFSFFLGWVLSAHRLRSPMDAHRWLLTAHEVALQEGLMMLGLAFAMGFTRLSDAWSLAAAWLLVVAGVFQVASGVVNWLAGTGDQFAQRSAGWKLATLNAFTNTAGLAIVVVGVLRAL
jgi:hypothetical protein